jgi:hypothetical protein
VSLVVTRVFDESRLLMGILLACLSQSRTLGSNGHAAEEKWFLMSAFVCLVSHVVVLVLSISPCRCIR